VTDNPALLNASIAIGAALLYVAASGRQLLVLADQRHSSRDSLVVYLALAAVIAHLATTVLNIEEGTLNFGFYKVASLIFLTMSMITLGALVIRPLNMIVIVTFPLAALSVLLNAFAPATGHPLDDLPDGVILHVTLSLLAFGVLSLAVFQAALVSVQTRALRQHHTRGIVQMLPALDLMERMFYELLHGGFLLLTVAIVSGAIFIEDIFSQHIAHKTLLTAAAWLVLLGVLTVHWRRGWRIGTAVALVFTAYALLALGFFGSKLVLELVL